MSKRVPPGLLLAIVAYVALRALILTTAFEEVVMPMFELYPMGTMAELKLRGVDFPLRYYYDNAAGQLVIGHLAIPFFALLGPSYMTLKLVPATLGFLTLLLVWRLLDRHFSRAAANVGALLFAIAPPTLVRYSLVCSGNHYENLFFTLLFLVAFYRHHDALRTRASLLLASFTAGLAIFVFLGAIIPVGICLGMHLGLSGWKRALRDAPVAAAGFVVGILPLVIVNFATSARGLGFLTAKFGDAGGPAREGSVVERIGRFLGESFVAAGQFEPAFGLTRMQLGAVFVAAFACAWALSLPSAARGIVELVRGVFRSRADGDARDGSVPSFESVKLVPFVVCLPLAALAFGISNFRVAEHGPPMEVGGYRYYLPSLVFALILIAIWSARLFERGGRARIAGTVLAGATLLVDATSFALVDWSFRETGNGWRYEGYNFAQMARGFVSARNALPHDEIVARVGSLPDEFRERVVRALGFNLGTAAIEHRRKLEGDAWTFPIDDVIGGYPEAWHLTLANGAGTALRFMVKDRTQDLPDVLRRVKPAAGPLADEIAAGSAFVPVAPPVGREVRVVLDQDQRLAALELPNKGAFLRGFGTFCGRLMRRGIPSEIARVDELRQRFGQPEFLDGLSRGEDGRER